MSRKKINRKKKGWCIKLDMERLAKRVKNLPNEKKNEIEKHATFTWGILRILGQFNCNEECSYEEDQRPMRLRQIKERFELEYRDHVQNLSWGTSLYGFVYNFLRLAKLQGWVKKVDDPKRLKELGLDEGSYWTLSQKSLNYYKRFRTWANPKVISERLEGKKDYMQVPASRIRRMSVEDLLKNAEEVTVEINMYDGVRLDRPNPDIDIISMKGVEAIRKNNWKTLRGYVIDQGVFITTKEIDRKSIMQSKLI